MSDLGKGHGAGTPYINPSVRGCYACEAVPCVLACPSGALDHHTEKAVDIKMGVAVLEHKRTCLAVRKEPIPAGYDKKMKDFLSKQTNLTENEKKALDDFEGYERKPCTLCADMCPMPNPLSAIAMITTNTGMIKPEIYDGCTGCGVCEEVCPTEQASIVIQTRLSFEDYYIKGVRV